MSAKHMPGPWTPAPHPRVRDGYAIKNVLGQYRKHSTQGHTLYFSALEDAQAVCAALNKAQS